MRNILTFIIILFTTLSYSQTLDETVDWISRNSDGKEQIFYDKYENKVLFSAVRTAGGLTSFVNEIKPNDVKSISVKYRNDGWQLLSVNLKTEGVNVKSYTEDKNLELIGEKKYVRQYAISILIECDRSTIDKFKKAYIHFFKLLDVDVKDGDMF
ncbi:hypothetical protein [uncultured Gelidibacter sp.]|uniref:hypothetical protein n=1 Tax=uncultured Gelidibacter sp. TaxID=259318 RepID=UPI00261D81BE|nr:hypothetical protein [uncultured Gelidibacter sp.]